MFAGTAIMVRFGYYFTVNVALLSALCCWKLFLRVPYTKDRPGAGLGVAAVVFIAFIPNLFQGVTTASTFRGERGDWFETLQWIRHHTPEPFGTPDAYYELPRYTPNRIRTGPPEASYGILAWWDYGYSIIREARCVPITNPTQHHAHEAARFFLERDPEKGKKYNFGSLSDTLLPHFLEMQSRWITVATCVFPNHFSFKISCERT